MSTEEWGSELGLQVLKKLSKLYVNLIWESTVLLAICSGEYTPGPGEFARQDLLVIFPPSKDKPVLESNSTVRNIYSFVDAFYCLNLNYFYRFIHLKTNQFIFLPTSCFKYSHPIQMLKKRKSIIQK